MRPEDVAEVVVLERLIFEDPWPEQAFRSDLEDPLLSFTRVARSGLRTAPVVFR